LVAGEGFTATVPIRPVIGRGIAPGDGAVAMLGYSCWRRYFQGSPAALGKVIRIEGKPFTVIGVAPESFTDMEGGGALDAIVPLASYTSVDRIRQLRNPSWDVTGRLRPGMTLEGANAELQTLWPQIRPNATTRLVVESAATGSGFNFPRTRFSYSLKVLLGMVGVLLLLASTNLATLLLARSAARRRETGVRLALGASRVRILRQYLAESLLLALGGAAAGILIARWATRFLAQFVWTGNLDRFHDVSIDGNVLAFTVAAATLSGLLFGLIPGWRSLHIHPAEALRSSGRGMSATMGRTGKLLVVFQVALSLVLVTSAALFTQTQRNLRTLPLGFEVSSVLGLQLMNRPGAYEGVDLNVYYAELFRRLSAVPGVVSVTATNRLPVMPPIYPDRPVSAGDTTVAVQIFPVAPDYFRTMNVPVVEGREFSGQDTAAAPRVAIISQSLASRLFPESSAVGRRVTVPDSRSKDFIIAGVVRDSYTGSLQNHNALQLYTSAVQQDLMQQPFVLVRTAGAPSGALIGQLRAQVQALGREYPMRIQSMENMIDRALVKERMMAALAGSLGFAALLLSAVGLYGLMSYSVSCRMAEIGIRTALGADRGAIVRMILYEALKLVGTGFAVGLPAVYAGSKLIGTLLFGVEPLDGRSLVMAATLLAMVSISAVARPARRAASLDPMKALRSGG
jgi:putative ABC transport system permease protein